MHNFCNTPQIVKISGPDSDKKPTLIVCYKYCPYRIIHDYMQVRANINCELKEPPLFVFSDGRSVKAQDFRMVWKQAIKSLGLEESNYETHSLRIGRAKDFTGTN